MLDYNGNEIRLGDKVQFWDGVYRTPKRIVYGHVKAFIAQDHVVVGLLRKLKNGQERLTMPADKVLVVQAAASDLEYSSKQSESSHEH